MKISKSEVKLEEFNNCLGKDKIKKLLDDNLGNKFEVVDTDKEYWINNEDTLVIRINGAEVWRFGEDCISKMITGIGELVWLLNCDEFHTEKAGRSTIIRFWWD